MLKAVNIDPQSIQATTLQVLREKRIMLQQQSEEVRVNLLINELVEEAVEREPMNADLYKRLMDGYITEREFIDALENVSQMLDNNDTMNNISNISNNSHTRPIVSQAQTRARERARARARPPVQSQSRIQAPMRSYRAHMRHRTRE